MTYFKTTQSDLLRYNGQRIVAYVPLPENKYDKFDVRPMFYIKLESGAMLAAFEDEIIEQEVNRP